MSKQPARSDNPNPATAPNPLLVYQIRLEGHLNQQWAEWFGGLTITLEDNGDTLLTCAVVDQAALHGLLRKVREMNMTLLSVVGVNSGQVQGGCQTGNERPNRTTLGGNR